MSSLIKIFRNNRSNTLELRGSSNDTLPIGIVVAALSADGNPDNIDIAVNGTGDTIYRYFGLPYTEIRDEFDNSFANAAAAVAYIEAQGNTPSGSSTGVITGLRLRITGLGGLEVTAGTGRYIDDTGETRIIALDNPMVVPPVLDGLDGLFKVSITSGPAGPAITTEVVENDDTFTFDSARTRNEIYLGIQGKTSTGLWTGRTGGGSFADNPAASISDIFSALGTMAAKGKGIEVTQRSTHSLLFTSGEIVGLGINEDPLNPNVMVTPELGGALVPIHDLTLQYRDGSGGRAMDTNLLAEVKYSDTTSLWTKYDDGTGTLAAVPDEEWTVHPIFVTPATIPINSPLFDQEFKLGLPVIQVAQKTIPDATFRLDPVGAAYSAILSHDVHNLMQSYGVLVGVIAARQDATGLDDTDNCLVLSGGMDSLQADTLSQVTSDLSVLAATASMTSILHVSAETGDDSNTGAMNSPFATVGAAFAAAEEGYVIQIANGTYTVNLSPTASDPSVTFRATSRRQVTFQADDTWALGKSKDIFYAADLADTSNYTFEGIVFSRSKYAVRTKTSGEVRVIDCLFENNGWSGQGLHTVAPSTMTGLLGYDSTQAELQAFWDSGNGPEVSDGGAVRVENASYVSVRDCTAEGNLRGIRVSDCQAGFIANVRALQNLESGIYVGAGANGGCSNVTVYDCFSAYNANNGYLIIGGIDNLVGVSRAVGNWNAGLCAWGAANTTLKSADLSDNNRSPYNGIGNTGDARSSVQINEAYDLLGTTISLNPNARFIFQVRDTQVHYTGVGSSTTKCGFLVTAEVGNLPENEKNIIHIDNCDFIAQDYAIDFSECDLTNLKVNIGNNTYQSIGIKAIREHLAGYHNEKKYTNHVTSVPYLDVEVDVIKRFISLKDGVGGHVIDTYFVNELQAVRSGNRVHIILKDTNKIQLRDNEFGNVTVNGVQAGNDVDSMVNTLNAAFGLSLENYHNFLVSEVGINSGGSLPAQADNWYIAYGPDALTQVTSAGIAADIKDSQPYYNGDNLDQGHEFVWTHDTGGDYLIGIYTGAEEAKSEIDIFSSLNWSTAFRFVSSSGRFSGTESIGVDTETRWATGTSASGQYDVNQNTTLALRYGNDNHLYLLDITSSTEVVIGRSTGPLVGSDIQIFFGGSNQPDAKFPVMQERTERWTIIADFDESEGGEWADGIEEDTVLRSTMEVNPGEKVTMNFDYFGRFESFGFGYTGTATGQLDADNFITDGLFYNSAELLRAPDGAASGGIWTWNTAASKYYDPNGDGSNVGYWQGSGVNLGLISWRYGTDNVIEMWHETNNELIATLTAPLDGSPFQIYFAVSEDHPVERIPELVKYDLDSSENGTNIITWRYIESPDGVFVYPLTATPEEAASIDTIEGGAGNSSGYSFGDTDGTTYYGPATSFVPNGTVAPSHGVYGNSTNVIWNEITTADDSTYQPPAFSDTTLTLSENSTLNFQIHPAGADFTTTIANAPAWITQAAPNNNVTGQSPIVLGDNANFPSESFTVDIVRSYAGYGSSTGTLTVVVENMTVPYPHSGVLHTGSIIVDSGTNSAGTVYLGTDDTDLPLVCDVATLEDGDSLEWYHQDQYHCYGIVKAGVDKTTDIADYNSSPSSRWDLFAPFTGTPTNTLGQNFGNVYGSVGLVPHGWDDDTNHQAIPTRPVYASSDVWKLYNNGGTLELSLNGVLFRSSASTYTDPVITFALPAHLSGYLPMPSFTHTANAATAPTGFTLEEGSMDTSSILDGNSVVSFDNFTLSQGQRLIVSSSWVDTYVLPYIDGAGGANNKAFLGILKSGAALGSLDLNNDFNAVHRWENNGLLETGLAMSHGGTSTLDSINRLSDSSSFFDVAIDFSRDGKLSVLRSSSLNPSLTTEPLAGGTFTSVQTWTDALATTGGGPLEIIAATKGVNTRMALSESGISVITSPTGTNEFDVTEDTFSLPLFNGEPAGDITLNAGQTYKFWMHSSSIESTDSLQFCLISDSSVYSTGVTTVGTPGTMGAYVEFAIPQDVPPVKIKWTTDGTVQYGYPTFNGSTYSTGITGISLEGPSGNQSGTEVVTTSGTGHGWLSLTEPLHAGQRLVIPNEFFYDLYLVNSDVYEVMIGLKGDSWSNTEFPDGNGQVATGVFKGDLYLRLIYGGPSSIGYQIFTPSGISNSMLSNSPNYHDDACAFLELDSTGDNIRIGVGLNGYYGITQGAEETYTYSSWIAYKKETGDQGFGIESLDVMFLIHNIYSGDSYDVANVDWTALTEVATPVSLSISSPWRLALDFDGSSEHLKQQGTSSGFNALRLGGLSALAAGPTTPNYTSNDPKARPWATTTVFTIDGHSSDQYIWNNGEGAGTTDDNIYLRVDGSNNLWFGWGRTNDLNEVQIKSNLSTSVYYGVYIAHDGRRLSSADATPANLMAAFDIRIMSSVDAFNSVTAKDAQVPLSRWSNSSTATTGGAMDQTVMGDYTVGGRGILNSFRGQIARAVVVTLPTNSPMPDDQEIKLMVIDPRKWIEDYRIGQPWRHPNAFVTTADFQLNQLLPGGAAVVWEMSQNPAYGAYVITNYTHEADTYTRASLMGMPSGSYVNVIIPGLS